MPGNGKVKGRKQTALSPGAPVAASARTWDAFPIVWEDYLVDTETFLGKQSGLGHAGVLIVNRANGRTEYWEYGRYDKAKKGFVRRVEVPDVAIRRAAGSATGAIDQTSLQATLAAVSASSGQNGRMTMAHVKNVDGVKMSTWFGKGGRNGVVSPKTAPRRWKGYKHPVAGDYELLSKNCVTFVADGLRAGGATVPTATLSMWPNMYIDTLREEYDDIDYAPRVKGSFKLTDDRADGPSTIEAPIARPAKVKALSRAAGNRAVVAALQREHVLPAVPVAPADRRHGQPGPAEGLRRTRAR